MNLQAVCGKPWERMSPILVKLTSYSDSNFERSNISFKENKPDGVDSNSNGFNYCVRKTEGRTLRFSVDCVEVGPDLPGVPKIKYTSLKSKIFVLRTD